MITAKFTYSLLHRKKHVSSMDTKVFKKTAFVIVPDKYFYLLMVKHIRILFELYLPLYID